MKRCIALLVALAVASGPAFAQQRERRVQGQGKNQGTSKDQRQGMRDDMREVFRDRNRQDRPPQRQLSPQEREKLRRDIQDANKDLRK
ncbi:MAG TPA: hypothetical protein VLI89_02105 [Burkholderiales bacterium]|nr:hypothetical protein [Burkholderiales bacterium]